MTVQLIAIAAISDMNVVVFRSVQEMDILRQNVEEMDMCSRCIYHWEGNPSGRDTRMIQTDLYRLDMRPPPEDDINVEENCIWILCFAGEIGRYRIRARYTVGGKYGADWIVSPLINSETIVVSARLINFDLPYKFMPSPQ